LKGYMDEAELIFLASKYVQKNYDYDTMYYCDDFNGKEEFARPCHNYMVEFKEIGRKAFYEKYKEYKLY